MTADSSVVLSPSQLKRLRKTTIGICVVSWAVVLLSIQIGYITTLAAVLFLVAVGTTLIVVIHLAGAYFAGVGRVALPASVSVIVLTAMLVLLELTLRWGVQTRATYGELNGMGGYRSVYAYDNPTWFHQYAPNETVVNEKTEFAHRRTTNALGLAEGPMSVSKPADEYRVLAIGDSHTEGVGATYDETWVKAFERGVGPLRDGRVVRAFNAGIGGSDLFFELVLFRDRLVAYRPDLVIVALNNSDVTDVIVRGGAERFRSDGTVRPDLGPSWDWLYGTSYIVRHIVRDVLGYSSQLLSVKDQAAAEASAVEKLQTVIDEFSDSVRASGARFVLVVNPHEYKVQAREYLPAFKRLTENVKRSQKIPVIDVLESFLASGTISPANSGEFYWKLDFHHNARGYALMGGAIAAEAKARDLFLGAR